MVRLSSIALFAGVVMSFHDTLYLWAVLFVAVWAGLASVENMLRKR